jgi:hypothetical protein
LKGGREKEGVEGYNGKVVEMLNIKRISDFRMRKWNNNGKLTSRIITHHYTSPRITMHHLVTSTHLISSHIISYHCASFCIPRRNTITMIQLTKIFTVLFVKQQLVEEDILVPISYSFNPRNSRTYPTIYSFTAPDLNRLVPTKARQGIRGALLRRIYYNRAKISLAEAMATATRPVPQPTGAEPDILQSDQFIWTVNIYPADVVWPESSSSSTSTGSGTTQNPSVNGGGTVGGSNSTVNGGGVSTGNGTEIGSPQTTSVTGNVNSSGADEGNKGPQPWMIYTFSIIGVVIITIAGFLTLYFRKKYKKNRALAASGNGGDEDTSKSLPMIAKVVTRAGSVSSLEALTRSRRSRDSDAEISAELQAAIDAAKLRAAQRQLRNSSSIPTAIVIPPSHNKNRSTSMSSHSPFKTSPVTPSPASAFVYQQQPSGSSSIMARRGKPTGGGGGGGAHPVSSVVVVVDEDVDVVERIYNTETYKDAYTTLDPKEALETVETTVATALNTHLNSFQGAGAGIVNVQSKMKDERHASSSSASSASSYGYSGSGSAGGSNGGGGVGVGAETGGGGGNSSLVSGGVGVVSPFLDSVEASAAGGVVGGGGIVKSNLGRKASTSTRRSRVSFKEWDDGGVVVDSAPTPTYSTDEEDEELERLRMEQRKEALRRVSMSYVNGGASASGVGGVKDVFGDMGSDEEDGGAVVMGVSGGVAREVRVSSGGGGFGGGDMFGDAGSGDSGDEREQVVVVVFDNGHQHANHGGSEKHVGKRISFVSLGDESMASTSSLLPTLKDREKKLEVGMGHALKKGPDGVAVEGVDAPRGLFVDVSGTEVDDDKDYGDDWRKEE